MAQSPYSLPKAKRASASASDALNRQLQAVEADIEAGRLIDAANSLNQLVATHPDDARIYVAGWLLATRSGNADAAHYAAERALDLDPGSAAAHYCLSDAEHKLGDNVSAKKSIDQALHLAPQVLQFRELAVNIANAEADHLSAEKHLRAAFAQNDTIPGIKTMIGNALRYQGKLDESEPWLIDAVALNLDDADAHHGLAMIAYLRDQNAVALLHLSQALRVRPDDAGFLYLKAIFSGETPPEQPEGMTRGLFDRYANRFDTHLVGSLKYRVPQMISQKILAHFPERNINVLDLGCGTGLLGAALGTVDGYFVGVDLSLPMIEEAKKHSVYSRFHNVNLLEALDATDADEYEVIVAADVFIYVGALEAAIANAFKVLKAGGWLYFSCESAPDDGADFVLHKSMRYAHSPAYVKRLLNAAGFAEPAIDVIDLRMEETELIPGYLVTVQKPA